MINLVSAKSILLNHKSLIYIPELAKPGSIQYNLKFTITSYFLIPNLSTPSKRKAYYGEIAEKKNQNHFCKVNDNYLAKYDLFDLAVTSDKKYWSLI